ncbi:hypothetical protein HDV05_004899 [Chytridiales sp. JEL 0842]|nr:hypothetical protein HDV05_004899 [Chytridiales sp. JEL 0842]
MGSCLNGGVYQSFNSQQQHHAYATPAYGSQHQGQQLTPDSSAYMQPLGCVQLDYGSLGASVGQPPVVSQQQQQPQVAADPAVKCAGDLAKSKAQFVEGLVDTAASIIESIWPHHSYSNKSKLLPLKHFIQEILRRSKTSFSTLQLALLYTIRLRNNLNKSNNNAASSSFCSASACTSSSASPACSSTATATATTSHQQSSEQQSTTPQNPTLCGRRMFLSSLIVATKYLKDRTYSNKAWAKISGLPLSEINDNERVFLQGVNYELFVSASTFGSWSTVLVMRANSLRRNVQQQASVEVATPAAAPSSLYNVQQPTTNNNHVESLDLKFSRPLSSSASAGFAAAGSLPSPRSDSEEDSIHSHASAVQESSRKRSGLKRCSSLETAEVCCEEVRGGGGKRMRI